MPRPKKTLPRNGIKIIRTMAGNGARQIDIATKLGMSFDVFHRLKQEDERIQRALDEGNATGHEKIMGKLFEKAMDGDTIACIFLCKIKYGYKEGVDVQQHHKVRVTFDLPGALPAAHYEKLINPPEQLSNDDG